MDELKGKLSAPQVKLLEIAWQLVADHSLQIESSKLGAWAKDITPAVQACQKLFPSLFSENANVEALTDEAAFHQFAIG